MQGVRKVIGVVGAAGSGKDTVANYLIENYGFERGQFARKLKDIVCDVYGWDREKIEELAYKEEVPMIWNQKLQHSVLQCPGPDGKGLTRRQVLQHIGTEGFRHCSKDTWVMCEEREHCRFPTVSIVFPDVRFLNEAEMIRRMGGTIWRVKKLDGPGTAFGDHKSETELELVVADQLLSARHGEIPKLLEQADQLLFL